MNETQQILNSIANKKVAPVYLLMGTEPYFIDEISTALMNAVVDESARDFDLTVLYGKETTADQILEAVKRYPMLGKQQLIVVKEAQYLDRTIDALASYCASPQPQTVLVLCYKHKKIDKRKKLLKNIAAHGVVLETKPLFDNQIGPWIENRGKKYGFSFHPQALAMLVAYLGSNLGKVDKELEKLTHSLASGSKVTVEHIEHYIGYSKDFNSFELQKALGKRQLELSYRIVKYMAGNPSQHPLPLTIGVLFNFFQKLFMYHGLNRPADAPKVLGVSPYFVKDYQAAAQKFSMRQVAQVISILKTYDLKSKGLGANNMPMEELLKEMILKIVSV
ncbi:MAG: DNA polymerase III subunit delta [Flavobacteriaceae bacterium]